MITDFNLHNDRITPSRYGEYSGYTIYRPDHLAFKEDHPPGFTSYELNH